MAQFDDYKDIFRINRYRYDYVLESYIGNVEGTLVIPEGVTRIAEDAFSPTWVKDYSKIKKIVFPSTLRCIPARLCSMWEQLEEVVIPEGITTISDSAFFNTAIKEIIIPSTVNRIGKEVFNLCEKLESVIINHSTTAIINRLLSKEYNKNSFWGNRKEPELAFKVYVGSSKEIELSRFFRYSNPDNEKMKFSICDWFVFYGDFVVGYIGNETTLRLPDASKGIAYEAFCNNKTIKSVILNDKLKGIGSLAFANCTQLQSVTLNENLEEIEDGAFKNCGIREIRIPQKVKYVGARAFENCTQLRSIIIKRKVEDYYRKNWHSDWKLGFDKSPEYEILF